MADQTLFDANSNLIRFLLKSIVDGTPKTGLSSSSSGLIISTITNNESAATTYAQASSKIESITTLGTFATPTATKCRFKEVDATNHPGIYEFQFDDARFSVASAKKLIISVSGASASGYYEIQLVGYDPYTAAASVQNVVDGVLNELSASHVTAGTIGKKISDAGSAGDPWSTALPGSYGAGTAGKIVGDNVNATISSRAPEAGGNIAAIKTKTDFLPSAAAGAAGGVFIAGSNAATSVNITGALSGSVGSVSGAVGSVTGNVLGSVIGSVASVTGNVGGNVVGSVAGVTGSIGGSLTSTERNAIADAILARTLGTESYAADGSVPTLAQAIFALISKEFEMSISGTTLTCKKLDGSTSAMTFTLNSATVPTSITRAT